MKVVLLLSSLWAVSSKISCQDATGTSVDWWAGLKKPGGVDFVLYNPSTSAFDIAQSLYETKESNLKSTLKPLYSGSAQARNSSASVGFILYNDEDPSGKNHETNGHTKGTLAFDDESGFWLVHSVPKFPQTDRYWYPDPQMVYGQSFFCVSFSLSTLDTIATALQFNRPFIYSYKIPEALKSRIPNLDALASGTYVKGSKAMHQSVTSSGGVSLTQFAKTGGWDSELYEKWVSPHFNLGFDWETWQNGEGDTGSYCHGKGGCQFDAINVATVTLPDGTSYPVRKDHSKWGVSRDSSDKIACIGDINRQHGQESRGGGTLCVKDTGLWTAFNSIVSAVQTSCSTCD